MEGLLRSEADRGMLRKHGGYLPSLEELAEGFTRRCPPSATKLQERRVYYRVQLARVLGMLIVRFEGTSAPLLCRQRSDVRATLGVG